MKLFKTFTLLLLFLIAMNCTVKSKSFNNEQNVANQNITSIEKISLSERTRGTNRTFTISNGKLETSINGSVSQKEVTQNEWSKTLEFVNLIQLEQISKLESPSTKRYTDAALASVITITQNGTEYKSSAFDSGNPPAELKSLYDEIQKLIQIEKSR